MFYKLSLWIFLPTTTRGIKFTRPEMRLISGVVRYNNIALVKSTTLVMALPFDTKPDSHFLSLSLSLSLSLHTSLSSLFRNLKLRFVCVLKAIIEVH